MYNHGDVGLPLAPKIPALFAAPLYGHGSNPSDGAGAAQVAGAVPTMVPPGTAVLSPLPLVVFSHGLGGMRAVSSGACCDLASHGYVVGAVEHRHV